MQQPRQRRAEFVDGAGDNRDGHGVAFAGRLENGAASGELGLLAEEPREHGIAPAMHGSPGVGLNCARGEHGLQAAAIAAGADGAVRLYRDVTQVAGHAAVPAQEAAVDQGGAAHTVAQGQHQDVLPPARRAPHDLAGQGDARVVIGEYRHFQRQAHDIRDAQSLAGSAASRAGFRCACVSGSIRPLQPTPTPEGKAVLSTNQLDGVLQRRQERVQVGRSLDGARCENRALFVHHPGPDLITADIDA